MNRLKFFLAALSLTMLTQSHTWACATCYGQSDSNLAAGMNWGIVALAAVAYCVVFGIVGFFGYIVYRSHKMAAQLEMSESGDGIATQSDLNQR